MLSLRPFLPWCATEWGLASAQVPGGMAKVASMWASLEQLRAAVATSDSAVMRAGLEGLERNTGFYECAE